MHDFSITFEELREIHQFLRCNLNSSDSVHAAWSTTVLPRVGNLFDSRADRKFKVGGDERTYRIYDTASIYEAVAECVRFNFPLLRGTN